MSANINIIWEWNANVTNFITSILSVWYDDATEWKQLPVIVLLKSHDIVIKKNPNNINDFLNLW